MTPFLTSPVLIMRGDASDAGPQPGAHSAFALAMFAWCWA
jgi:hypothetical protein